MSRSVDDEWEEFPEVEAEPDSDASVGQLVFYALCFVGVMGLAAWVAAR